MRRCRGSSAGRASRNCFIWAARSVGMTRMRPFAWTTTRSWTPHRTTGSRSDHTMQSCDSSRTPRPTTTFPLGSFGRTRASACQVPDIVPGEGAAHHRDGIAALQQAHVDRDRRDVPEEAGHVAGLEAGERGGHLGRVPRDLAQEPLGGPGEEAAVPERARRHQVERRGGVRLLGEPGDGPRAAVERRTGTM